MPVLQNEQTESLVAVACAEKYLPAWHGDEMESVQRPGMEPRTMGVGSKEYVFVPRHVVHTSSRIDVAAAV